LKIVLDIGFSIKKKFFFYVLLKHIRREPKFKPHSGYNFWLILEKKTFCALLQRNSIVFFMWLIYQSKVLNFYFDMREKNWFENLSILVVNRQTQFYLVNLEVCLHTSKFKCFELSLSVYQQKLLSLEINFFLMSK